VRAVSELKEQPGQDILLYGSANLVRTLTENRLIDEYRFMIFPLILGTGRRLFADGSSVRLKLVEARPLSSGVVILTYQPEVKA
jgi:dihydrofolate reductase